MSILLLLWRLVVLRIKVADGAKAEAEAKERRMVATESFMVVYSTRIDRLDLDDENNRIRYCSSNKR
jgi:hypothetical protein